MTQKGFISQLAPQYQQWLMFPRLHIALVTLLSLLWIVINPSASGTKSPSTPFLDTLATTSPSGVPSDHLDATADRKATDSAQLPPDFLDPLSVTSSSATPTPIPQELLIEPPKNFWKTYEVRSGDNLSKVFYRAGLSDRDVYLFIKGHAKAKELTNISPGQELELDVRDKHLHALRFQKDRLTSIKYSNNDGKFERAVSVAKPEIKQSILSGTINSSLFVAAQKAGLDHGLIMQLATIFGWDIDFVLDIRVGDTFRVVFEEKYLDGKKLGNGDILAAEFLNNGKTYQAVRYINQKGDKHYFTPDGQSMRKAFLRSPLDVVHITSHFNLKRKHPVLNRIRAHKGTDYRAKRGTPIKSVGDGKIAVRGWKGGYGRVVYIDHGHGYQTRYAHMSRFKKNVKVGSRVKQGQIIGYVGQSGLASGPHLHYEFHQNGRVRNPVTVKLPNARPIPKKQRKDFNAQTLPLLALLDDSPPMMHIATQNTEVLPNTSDRARL